MNNIMTIKNVRGYLDKSGTAYLNIEDVARGLGIIKRDHKDGVEYERINRQALKIWLNKFGILKSENDDLPDYIPENIFYKLCFKASNETARKFQDVVCDEILPTIRKTGIYSIDSYNKKSTSVGEVTNLIKTLKGIMKDEKHTPEEIANMAQIICDQFNVILPANFVKKPRYEQLSLVGNLDS